MNGPMAHEDLPVLSLWSREAEQAVLGALMRDNGVYDAIGDMLFPGDFFTLAHREIFDAIVALLTASKEADIITVAEHLDSAKKLDGVGGLPYLGDLVAAVPSTSTAAHYAAIVRKRRLERDLLAAGEMIVGLALDKRPLDERVAEAQNLVLTLSETAAKRDAAPIGEYLPAALEELERRVEDGREIVGLPTGLADLDARLRGLMGGQFVILAGRPGMGKSVAAGNIATHAALHGTAAAVFTLEMSAQEYTSRTIVSIARVPFDDWRSGRIVGQEDWGRISTAISRLTSAPLFIDDSEVSTVEQIAAKCRRLKRRHNLGLVVIDYLQLLEGQGESRREQVDSISRAVKRLAKDLAIPVIGVAQLNRALEQRTNKRPMLADLRESGGLEQDADVVVFLYRDSVYNHDTPDEGVIELDVAKQRNGPIGRVFCAWEGEFQRISNLAREAYPVPRTPTSLRRGETVMQRAEREIRGSAA